MTIKKLTLQEARGVIQRAQDNAGNFDDTAEALVDTLEALVDTLQALGVPGGAAEALATAWAWSEGTTESNAHFVNFLADPSQANLYIIRGGLLDLLGSDYEESTDELMDDVVNEWQLT